MTVAVFENAQQNCYNPAPPLTAGGYGCGQFLSSGPVGAMLRVYAGTAITVVAGLERQRLVRHGLQMGGRQWRDPFQRSAQSEGGEADRSRCAVLRFQGCHHRSAPGGAPPGPRGRAGLRDRHAGGRPGIPGHHLRQRTRHVGQCRPRRFPGHAAPGRPGCFRAAGAQRQFRAQPGGSRRAHPEPAGDRRPRGGDLPGRGGDLLRPATQCRGPIRCAHCSPAPTAPMAPGVGRRPNS